MDNKVISQFNKNARETVQVALNNFKGYNLLDIRVYTKDGTGKLVPTRKGISISTRLIPQLKEALEKKEIEEAIKEAEMEEAIKKADTV